MDPAGGPSRKPNHEKVEGKAGKTPRKTVKQGKVEKSKFETLYSKRHRQKLELENELRYSLSEQQKKHTNIPMEMSIDKNSKNENPPLINTELSEVSEKDNNIAGKADLSTIKLTTNQNKLEIVPAYPPSPKFVSEFHTVGIPQNLEKNLEKVNTENNPEINPELKLAYSEFYEQTKSNKITTSSDNSPDLNSSNTSSIQDYHSTYQDEQFSPDILARENNLKTDNKLPVITPTIMKETEEENKSLQNQQPLENNEVNNPNKPQEDNVHSSEDTYSINNTLNNKEESKTEGEDNTTAQKNPEKEPEPIIQDKDSNKLDLDEEYSDMEVETEEEKNVNSPKNTRKTTTYNTRNCTKRKRKNKNTSPPHKKVTEDEKKSDNKKPKPATGKEYTNTEEILEKANTLLERRMDTLDELQRGTSTVIKQIQEDSLVVGNIINALNNSINSNNDDNIFEESPKTPPPTTEDKLQGKKKTYQPEDFFKCWAKELEVGGPGKEAKQAVPRSEKVLGKLPKIKLRDPKPRRNRKLKEILSPNSRFALRRPQADTENIKISEQVNYVTPIHKLNDCIIASGDVKVTKIQAPIPDSSENINKNTQTNIINSNNNFKIDTTQNKNNTVMASQTGTRVVWIEES